MMGYDLNTSEATAWLAAQDDAACYLIRKGGAWYRPNSRGYTTSAIQAGRYTLRDAEDITHPNGPVGPRDGMFYVHVSDVRDDDLAEVLRLSATVADLKLQLGMANHAEDATRADLDAVKTAIFGSAGYDPTLKIGNFCEMARTTEAARAGALGRAEAAEATVADLTAELAKSEEMRDHYLDAAYKATGLNQDLTAANIALAAECARLKGRDEVLRAIADLTEISGLEFAEKHPELNKLLDKAGYENWGKVLSEFAARAYLAGGE